MKHAIYGKGMRFHKYIFKNTKQNVIELRKKIRSFNFF